MDPFLLSILLNPLQLSPGPIELLLCLSDVVQLFPRGSQGPLFFLESHSSHFERGAIGLECRALGREFAAMPFEFLTECGESFFFPAGLFTELGEFALAGLLGSLSRIVEFPARRLDGPLPLGDLIGLG